MVLFDFNDIFVKFSEAVFNKFGKLPADMTPTEYNAAMGTLVKTNFYKDLPQQPLGFELLQWCLTYRDKEVTLILVNEEKSPTWVNNEKVKYLDAACTAMGLPLLDFSICKTEEEMKGHAWRGPLVSRSLSRRQVWNTQPGGYLSVNMEDNLNASIWNITQSFAQHL